jgi:hypothetical protein
MTTEQIVEHIKLISEELGVAPYDLTKAEVLESGAIKEWDLRKLGGLAAIRKAHFEEPIDLAGKRGIQIKKSYVNKLERELGERDYFLESVTKKVGEIFERCPLKISKASTIKATTSSAKSREVVALISDTHFGLNIDPTEVPGNGYNWLVASRRMGKFTEQVATYKIEHRKATPRLRLCLGGDLAQGIIHLNDAGTDLITNQVAGTADILVKMIDYLQHYYSEIVVEAVPCNHLRLPHKGPDRAASQKWDSFSTMIYLIVQAAFRSHKNIQFHFQKTPWADFEVLGHRVYLSHGDTVIEPGNVSDNININKLSHAINKLNAMERKKYEVVMLGHVHTPLYLSLKGVKLVINGTGSGSDGYAQSIGHGFHSEAVQTLFEVTPDYAVGDYRQIHLDDADEIVHYNTIISPWEYGLILDKK